MRSLLFISSALVLAGCSLSPTDTYYTNTHKAAQSSQYNQGCGGPGCYPVSNKGSTGHHGGHSYGHNAPQQPSAHAYGTQVQNHPAYQGRRAQAHHGQHPQLRGPYAPRHGYKYGNLGVVAYDLDTDIYGVQGRLGYQSAGYFGAEVEGSIGLTEDKNTVGTIDTELGVDYSVGAFALGRLPVADRFNLIGRVGYHATKFNAEIDDGVTVVEDSETFDGVAYGVGAEYAFDPRNSIRLDYTRYDINGLDGSTESMAVSFARKF